MKKWFRILALSVLLLFLCGCSSSEYRYLEKDGLSYIKLPGTSNSGSSNSSGRIPSIEFQTFEEMREDVVTGNFTEKEMKNLRWITCVGTRPLAINVNSPPVPVFPESWNIEREYISLSGYNFEITYIKDDIEILFVHYSGVNHIDVDKEYSAFGPPYYVLTDNQKKVYVTEYIDKNSALYGLTAYYEINGFEFQLHFSNLNSASNQRPSDRELLQIDIQFLNLKP